MCIYQPYTPQFDPEEAETTLSIKHRASYRLAVADMAIVAMHVAT
jgi:hypothetical protein